MPAFPGARAIDDALAAGADTTGVSVHYVDEEELRRVFNLGIGWCAVVREAEPGEHVIGRIA